MLTKKDYFNAIKSEEDLHIKMISGQIQIDPRLENIKIVVAPSIISLPQNESSTEKSISVEFSHYKKNTEKIKISLQIAEENTNS